MKTTRTILILAIVFAVLSCKNGTIEVRDSMFEKQEQVQIDSLLSSLPRFFVKSQAEKIEQLYPRKLGH